MQKFIENLILLRYSAYIKRRYEMTNTERMVAYLDIPLAASAIAITSIPAALIAGGAALTGAVLREISDVKSARRQARGFNNA
jgi:hypothetical protein